MNEIITFEQKHPVFTEYVRSSIITFLATFFSVLAMNISNVDATSLSLGIISGLVLAAVRAAAKVVIESLSSKQYPTPIIPTAT